MSDFARTLGERIRQVRGALSQADFAAKIGINKNLLGKYERGESVPGGEILSQIHDTAGVSLDWLLTGQGQMRRDEAAPAAASPATVEAQAAVNVGLYGQVLEQVAAVYQECGVIASLAQIGAKAAEIAGYLSSPDFSTNTDQAAALKYATTQLRSILRTANQAKPDDAQGKQSA